MSRDARITALRAKADAEDFNRHFPIGTLVHYWPGARKGDGIVSRTRTTAQVLGGHTAAVWVEGHSACIALTHVRHVLPDEQESTTSEGGTSE